MNTRSLGGWIPSVWNEDSEKKSPLPSMKHYRRCVDGFRQLKRPERDRSEVFTLCLGGTRIRLRARACFSNVYLAAVERKNTGQ